MKVEVQVPIECVHKNDTIIGFHGKPVQLVEEPETRGALPSVRCSDGVCLVSLTGYVTVREEEY